MTAEGTFPKVNADILYASEVNTIKQATLDNAGGVTNFKQSNSTFTDNDTSQTFTDVFCTTTSLVVVSVTDASTPQGIWKVTSEAGEFTITSDTAETDDIDFDYYIIK